MSKTPLLPTPKSHVVPRPRPPDPLWRVIVVLLTVVGGLYSASLALGLLANSEFDRLTTNITLDSDYDTGEAIVDRDYRFRLALPGIQWRLMREADVRRINPDMIAGAVDRDGHFGGVVIEASLDLTLTEYANLILDRLPLEEADVRRRSAVTYLDRPAMDVSVSGVNEGGSVGYRFRIFENGGYLYQLLTGTRGDVSAQTDQLGVFFDAFELLPGPVRRRYETRVAPDQRAPGWQVEGNRFRSPAYNLELTPPNSCSLLLEDELHVFDPYALVGLECPNAHLLLTSRPTRKDTVGAVARVLRRALSDVWGDLSEDAVVRVLVDDTQVPFAQIVAEALPIEIHHAVQYRAGRYYNWVAWRSTASAEAPLDLAELLSGVRFLENEERDELRRDAERSPPTTRLVAEHSAYRSHEFIDFLNHVSLVLPDADAWRVRIGRESRSANGGAVVFGEELSLGVSVGLWVRPTGGLSNIDYHQRAVSRAAGVAVESEAAPEREESQIISRFRQTLAGTDFADVLVTAVRDETAFELWIWGAPESIESNPSVVDQIVAGLRLFERDQREAELVGDQLVDRRFGFVLPSPGPEWEFVDETPSDVGGTMRIVGWKRGDQQLVLLASDANEQVEDEVWLRGFFEQTMRRHMAAVSGTQSDQRAVRLGDHDGTLMSWDAGFDEAHVATVVDQGVVFALMGWGVSEETVLESGFRLLN